MTDVSRSSFKLLLALMLSAGLGLAACSTASAPAAPTVSASQKTSSSSSAPSSSKVNATAPGTAFDLSHWKLTLPVDDNRDGKADSIRVTELQSYSHPDFFYMDEKGYMVFISPNKGGLTTNTGSTRSELRYMIRGKNRKIRTKAPLNNFALASHPNADEFGSIGGRMVATLHVDHVPLNANKPNHNQAYAGVIGQIHGVRLKEAGEDFGFGTEPLKIFYKKRPGHATGSVYWHYERNRPSGHPDKKDIAHLVWGKARNDSADPGAGGIALGEDFSYIVNVYEDTMYLTFVSPRLGRVTHEVNLANNVDLNGKGDPKDNPIGYAKDGHYFKAGIYNQCRGSTKKGESVARCQGTGDWETDKANGDYFQVSFSRLNVTKPTPPQ